MAAQTRKQEQRRYRRVRHLAMLVLVSLFLTLLLVLGTAQAIFARDNATTSTLQPVVSQATNTPALPTNTPVLNTPTVAPTATTIVSATPTPTTPVSATDTPVAAPTSPGTGSGGGTSGPAGPQSTKVVLSQPTVGNGSGNPLQGLSPASFGANGLLIATTLGCVVGLLGIAIGGIALYVLVQSGYGPFLRALALGNRRGKDRSGRWRSTPTSARSRFNDGYARGRSSPQSRQARFGEYGSGSGNRGRR